MTNAKLIEILKTYDLNAVVVLADSAGEHGKAGVARLRAGEIQLVELYQVRVHFVLVPHFPDGAGPPSLDKRTTVFDRKVKAILLDAP